MLILIWWASMSLPLAIFPNMHAQPLIADVFVDASRSSTIDPVGSTGDLDAVVGKDPNGLPMLVPVIEDPKKLDLLPGNGEVLSVTWPSHASFVPRALTANTDGSLLVVADDFNIYAGVLPGHATSRRLRDVAGHIQLDRVHACKALAGNSLKDVAIVCAHEQPSLCRLLVIVGRGKQLIECPLNSEGTSHVKSTANHSWNISQDWLEDRHDDKEHVESIAANYLCVKKWRNVNKTGQIFWPEKRGCAIVGTSRGRIVQIREGATDHSLLIPTRVMHQRHHPSSRGGLTLIRGMYQLALWSGYGTMSAFEVKSGKLLKEWRLPAHIKWVMVTGSREHLYLLGVRGVGAVEIYRFPLPQELREGEPDLQRYDL